MSDFLQFLNTADAESLTKIPGISTSLAENLIAARPFESVDDCLKVHGMGKNLLVRAQAAFAQAEVQNASEESALIPIEEQTTHEDGPIEKKRPVQETPPVETRPSFGTRLGQAVLWFFRMLLRLILFVLIISGVGAAIYYGAPLINNRFIAPVEQNAVHVTELENKVEALQTQLIENNRQLADINDQLSEVNKQLDEDNGRFDKLEQSIDGHTAILTELADMQTALEEQLKENNDKTLLSLKREIMMTRALDMLARARLYLAQSNFGLAKEDVQSARDLLNDLQSEPDDEALSQVTERLDMALVNLPGFPVIASGDLEIAWQILMTGESIPSPTPGPTLETTTTPEATPEVSPSATATP